MFPIYSYLIDGGFDLDILVFSGNLICFDANKKAVFYYYYILLLI